MHSHATTHYFLQQDIYWILGEEETKKLPHHVKVVTPFEAEWVLRRLLFRRRHVYPISKIT